MNWVMIYLLQNMQSLAISDLDSIRNKVQEMHPAIKTNGQAGIPPHPVYSKELFAYIEAQSALSMYFKSDDPRIAGSTKFTKLVWRCIL